MVLEYCRCLVRYRIIRLKTFVTRYLFPLSNLTLKIYLQKPLNLLHRRRSRGDRGTVAPPSPLPPNTSPNWFVKIFSLVIFGFHKSFHGEIIRTMCETFNKTRVNKMLLGQVQKLLRMYLTLPVASATSERTFTLPSHH